MANTTGKKFGGRKKGTPNKTTKEIRDSFQFIIDKNLNNLDKWLNKIGKDNPEKAITLILNISEYVLPKLNKIEFDEKIEDDIENMTDEEIDAELKKLREKGY
ncbi:hypothetical protein PL373_01655 [Tenacibaculum maritimum]|nr:hypothetical protein [Tenacibaculum maritimum]MDB0599877.1 hypothetical protein [Tenacibaculum maritimum]MDB0610988.1 hypothetical protein [Tenacibaculum maritimum]